MKLKSGVDVSGVSLQVWYACGVADRVFEKYSYECVATSMRDGVHNEGSLHTAGDAVDFRVKHVVLSSEREQIFKEIKQALEKHGFDVVWEGGTMAQGAVGATPATTGAHIHIEYQPKAGERFMEFTS